MDIAHLKTFLEIYKTRHFGKSAERLHITQSATSARIKSLEERLGVTLFSRDKHSIEPTPAGHRFHHYAEITVTGWERARQMLGLPEEYTRTLSIGCLPDTWNPFVKRWMDSIKSEMPDTGFNLTIHPEHNVQELILSNALDLGFVFEPINIPKLNSVEIAPVNLRLLANQPGLSVDEALSEGYVMTNWGALFEYEHSRAYRDYPASALTVNHGVMALDLLTTTQQQRAAYLPCLTTTGKEDYIQADLYSVQGAPTFARGLFLVYQEDSPVLSRIAELQAIVSRLATQLTCS